MIKKIAQVLNIFLMLSNSMEMQNFMTSVVYRNLHLNLI